jgi:hypothetical protein
MGELGQTVAQMVANQLPSGFAVLSDYIIARQKWWETLLIGPATDWGQSQNPVVVIADKYTEADWPDEWNMLIAYLIIYDIFQKAITGALLLNTNAGSNGATGKPLVKIIKTGPTEVEYQDTASAFAALMKVITTNESPFFLVFSNACILGSQLKIKLPFCPGNSQPFILLKAGRCIPCGQGIVGNGGIFAPPSTGGVWNSGENYLP